jgi:DtxR family Mn-dependent transcriptional regulator
MAEWHPAFEEYTETIFELEEDGIRVVQARIADRLSVSRPAVSEMVHRMQREGLLTITGGVISLTDEGRNLAQRTVRRHRLAERFLTDILGLSWATAHHEAGKWEHVISPEVEAAMIRVLGAPTTCPHGNPIPGSDYTDTHAVPLGDLAVGATFTVERIPEELEFEDGLLDHLEAVGLIPGTSGVVSERSHDGGVLVDVDGHSVTVDSFVTSRMLVQA